VVLGSVLNSLGCAWCVFGCLALGFIH
jgi:hypothetical protein